ncbi:MAG: fused MFS/spermidine synthase [Betaproteobacteria bacterium]|nr:fused MFS/spermidine synthase [Betaproteobacteria bacterium]MDE2622685.1 fused MFS/spermidine synthase [Betaproteobacteria bacterium]
MSCSIDIREEAGVRTLHFGSDWIQGAMRIARPWHLELDYTQDMMASLLFREEDRFPRQALLIGLGAASLTKFLYRHRPDTKLTVVEIDPAVVAAARQFFKLPDDPDRIRIVIDDGMHFVEKTGKTYDLILVDGFDANARAGALGSLPFYERCRQLLSRHGVLAVNLIGRSRSFRKSIERLKSAFEGQALAFPTCPGGNVIAFASGRESVDITIDALREQARQLKKSSALNLLPTLSRLEQSRSCQGGKLVI